LEYRGYDSAGIAVESSGAHVVGSCEVGKIHRLEEAVGGMFVEGHHQASGVRVGRPTDVRARPTRIRTAEQDRSVVITNGVIELP
jgi:glucosamine 6-phosphate synthetase-like amidotransferase/phosphosugar isomerase protein